MAYATPSRTRLAPNRLAATPTLRWARQRSVLAAALLLGGLLVPLASPAVSDAGSPPALPALDPEIAALVDSVSQDSLFSMVQTLQGFFTRHTNSDTVSTTTGIGAARRWVHDRLVAISNANGGNLQVSYDTFTATVSSITRAHRNVVATLPGTDPASADRVFIISGHLDSRNTDNNNATVFAPGANDDASGIGALLECARLMAGKSFESTIRFVAFTGEEQGLVGSAHYAAQARAEGENIEADLTNDIIGNVTDGDAEIGDSLGFDSTHVRLFSVDPSQSPSRQVSRLFESAGEAYEPEMDILLIPAQDRPGRGSDHISFNDNDYAATRMIDVFDNLIHQHATGDTFQVMNFPYYRRNVRLNLATLANLARAPRPVAGVLAGDVGNSTGFSVLWSPNPEGDLAGYRVTTRSLGALQYETVEDVGAVLSHLIVSAADSLFIGVAAYDTSGHLGIATEVLALKASAPLPPALLTASPGPSAIALDWANSPELDLLGYDVWRATVKAGPYAKQNAQPLPASSYSDAAVAIETFYYYFVTALDSSANQSASSDTVRGRVASFSKGILFVEETATGNGQPYLPFEAVQDSFYAGVMQNFPHDVLDYDSAAAAGGIAVADLVAYSSVVWVSDDRNAGLNGETFLLKFLHSNEDVVASYLDLGGNALVIGWAEGSGYDDAYPQSFGAGDFLYDYFRVSGLSVPGAGQQFWGATGALSYPSVVVDTSKTRPMWVGKLPDIEYYLSVGPGAETAYRYRAASTDSAFHNAPVGIRYDAGGFKTQFFDFPLYHLRTADARGLIVAAMSYFGEAATGVEDVAGAESAPQRIDLRAQPNPTRSGGTTVSFSLSRPAPVDLAIYSTTGERVRQLEKGPREAGRYRLAWDGQDGEGRRVASGVYFLRLKAGEAEMSRKLVLMR